jgi:hypothetical protein
LQPRNAPQPRKASILTDPRAIKEPPLHVIVAAKAVAEGTATEDQQRRFLAWLISDVCLYGQGTIYFGAPDKTYFAAGRQRVAEILKRYIETPIEKWNGGQPSEQVR